VLKEPTDPGIVAAQNRLRVAADLIERGRAELREVIASLERHPGFARGTLAWWLHDGTRSTLFDVEVDSAPELLLADADPERLASSLRRFMAGEKRAVCGLCEEPIEGKVFDDDECVYCSRCILAGTEEEVPRG
jgi:hypothetical protein